MIADLKPYSAYKPSGVEWLGDMPTHWEVRRLKSSVAHINDQTAEKEPDDAYIALEHVQSWTGSLRLLTNNIRFDSQVKRFKPNDVLFGKLRPYLAKVTRPTVSGVCVGEFLVLRPKKSAVAPAFLESTLRSKPIIDAVNSSTYGAKMPRADWGFVGGMLLPFPPLSEQSAIVRFLDYMDRRIRRYIRAKQQLIELLNEQKQAIIHHAVTRGLDPDVRLKPSGVEWLGDVPEHWEVWRVGHFGRVGNGSTPSRGNSAYWNGGTYPWLNSSSVNRSPIYKADQFVSDRALRECHLPRVQPGSVLVAITGQGKTRGTSAVLTSEATINQHIAYITPRPDVVHTDYLHLVFVGAYRELRTISDDSGSTKGALTCGDIANFRVALPPLDEQARIVPTVRRDTEGIEAAVSRTEREIDLLCEYRVRLIADVVTGKLDVREASARLPEEAEEPDTLEDTEMLMEHDESGQVVHWDPVEGAEA